jgi:hypothetical protein
MELITPLNTATEWPSEHTETNRVMNFGVAVGFEDFRDIMSDNLTRTCAFELIWPQTAARRNRSNPDLKSRPVCLEIGSQSHLRGRNADLSIEKQSTGYPTVASKICQLYAKWRDWK